MTADTVFGYLLHHESNHRHGSYAMRRGGKARPGRPRQDLRPYIGQLKVLEGFDANGNPKLRAPKSDITARMLMLHTAGLGYDFFNATYLRLAQERGSRA